MRDIPPKPWPPPPLETEELTESDLRRLLPRPGEEEGAVPGGLPDVLLDDEGEDDPDDRLPDPQFWE